MMRILNFSKGFYSVAAGVALILFTMAISNPAFGLEGASTTLRYSTITYTEDWDRGFLNLEHVMQAFDIATDWQGTHSCGEGNFEIEIHGVNIVSHRNVGLTIGKGTSYTIYCFS